MISGTVNPYREATIWLPVRVPEGRNLEIEAIIDTGLSDFIALPPAATVACDLNLHPMSPCEVINSGEEAR
jgi:predicted aspartyl protease